VALVTPRPRRPPATREPPRGFPAVALRAWSDGAPTGANAMDAGESKPWIGQLRLPYGERRRPAGSEPLGKRGKTARFCSPSCGGADSLRRHARFPIEKLQGRANFFPARPFYMNQGRWTDSFFQMDRLDRGWAVRADGPPASPSLHPVCPRVACRHFPGSIRLRHAASRSLSVSEYRSMVRPAVIRFPLAFTKVLP